jgi:hypothetical protein
LIRLAIEETLSVLCLCAHKTNLPKSNDAHKIQVHLFLIDAGNTHQNFGFANQLVPQIAVVVQLPLLHRIIPPIAISTRLDLSLSCLTLMLGDKNPFKGRRMYLMASSTKGGEKEAATMVSNLNSSYG